MSSNKIELVKAEANPLDLVDSIVEASAKGEISRDDLEICKNRLQEELRRRDKETK